MPNVLRSLAKLKGGRQQSRLAAVLELCERMDADPMNGGVVLTSTVRAVATGSSAPR